MAKKSKPSIDLAMGLEVRDLMSGVKGYISQKVELLSGSVQYAIQPVDKKGEALMDSFLVDWQLIEVLGPGLSERITSEIMKTDIKLGNEVKDIITGDLGIAAEKVIFTNGCISFFIVWNKPEGKKKENAIIDLGQRQDGMLSAARLSLVDEGVAAEINKMRGEEKTGGPSRRAYKMC